MRLLVSSLALALLLAASLAAGCNSDTSDTTATSTGATSSAASGTGGGDPICPNPDGACSLEEQQLPDPCACVDCQGTALCMAGQCVDDGECTILDACTCADCRIDLNCKTCDHDGSCESFNEGCDCDDCKETDACAAIGVDGGM